MARVILARQGAYPVMTMRLELSFHVARPASVAAMGLVPAETPVARCLTLVVTVAV